MPFKEKKTRGETDAPANSTPREEPPVPTEWQNEWVPVTVSTFWKREKSPKPASQLIEKQGL